MTTDVSVDYDDTRSNRLVFGSRIPWITDSVLTRWYGKVSWAHWGKLDVFRTFLGSSADPVVPSEVQQELGVTTRWDYALRAFFLCPNGQVKNFLVACRTFWGSPTITKVRICFRGSKSGQGGGIWYPYYAMWLASVCTDIQLDCFDYSEVPGTETFEYAGVNIVINRYARGYDGDAREYTAIIDDAYLPGAGIVSAPRYACAFYSLKMPVGSFMHVTEGRVFSQKPEDGPVYCKCHLCRTCSQVSADYEHYLFLRRACTVLGHDAKCLQDPNQYDLVTKGVTLRQLSTQPYVTVRAGVTARAMIALASEVRIKAVDSVRVRMELGSPVPFPFVHAQGMIDAPGQTTVCTFLEGRRVAFSGVLPSVLGNTSIFEVRNMQGTYSRGIFDALFAGTREAALTNMNTRSIFLPRKVHLGVAGWSLTGRQWKDFDEWGEVIGPPRLGAVFLLPSVKSRVLPHAPVDPSGVLQHSHPMPTKYHELCHPVLTIPFHWSVVGGSFQPVKSDMPLPYVYEEDDITDVIRGLKDGPFVLRHYRKEGRYHVGYTPKTVGISLSEYCFVQLKQRILRWDFIRPVRWKSFAQLHVRALREYFETGLWQQVQDVDATYYIPPTWGVDELKEMTTTEFRCRLRVWTPVEQLGKSLTVIRQMSILDPHAMQVLQSSPVGAWFVRHGFYRHFAADWHSQGRGTFHGISDETKGFEAPFHDWEILAGVLRRWFKVVDGQIERCVGYTT